MHIYTSILIATLLAQVPTQTYDAAIAEVDHLSEKINLGEPVNSELLDALSELPDHAPSIAADPTAQAIRTHAQLNLARAFLSEGDSSSAAGVMDDALRSSLGAELPVAEFGPALVALHAERQAALASLGTGSIEVQCRTPCRIYINERSSMERVDGLYFGLYRVWIESETDPDEVVIERINLTEAQPTAVIEFAPVPAPAIELDNDLPTPRRQTRIMPMPAETAMIVVGAGVALVGAVLLAVSLAERPNQESAYSSQPRPGRTAAGATLLGLGGASLLIGSVTLAVDEVRIGNARGQQATLGWRVRF